MATLGAPVFGVVFEVTSVGRARTFPALCAFRVLRRRSHPGDPQHGLSVARIATAEPAFRLVHHRVGLAHLHFSRRIQSGFDVGRLDQQSFAGSTPNWPMDRRHRCGGHPRPHRVFWPCLARSNRDRVRRCLHRVARFLPRDFLPAGDSTLHVRTTVRAISRDAWHPPPGKASGIVYGVSTLGNIAGVMLTAFVLIPHFRVSTLLYLWLAVAIVSLAALVRLLRVSLSS